MSSLLKGAASLLSFCSKAAVFNQQSAGLRTTSCLFIGSYKGIRGGGRPLPFYVPKPMPGLYGWKVLFPESEEYTIDPLPVHKLGGRNDAGRVVVETLGGGDRIRYRWIDNKRHAKPGEVLQERVLQVRYDPCRTAFIALVASGEKARWILASQDMEVGDLISTHGDIPRIPIQAKVGDSHPIGALPIGSIIHHVEIEPGKGGVMCMSAGSSAQLIRKIGTKCILKMPSKREICIKENCMVVVGTVINQGCRKPILTAQRNRHLGHRPRSGFFHKKDGYCGKKMKPKPTLRDYTKLTEDPITIFPLRLFPTEECRRVGRKKKVIMDRKLGIHVDYL